MTPPREPTAEECTAGTEIAPGYFAIWYPSTGGYVGRAVVRPNVDYSVVDGAEFRGGCDVWIWHDGDFAWSGMDGDKRDRVPAELHHCRPEDFVRFGKKLAELIARADS